MILTAEVAKNKMATTTKIYFNKFPRYFGLQHKPSLGAERKKRFLYILYIMLLSLDRSCLFVLIPVVVPLATCMQSFQTQ